MAHHAQLLASWESVLTHSKRLTEFALEHDLHVCDNVQVPAAVLLQVLAHDARDVLREALRSRARLPLCIGLLSFSKLHTRTPSLSSVYNGSLSVTTCEPLNGTLLHPNPLEGFVTPNT